MWIFFFSLYGVEEKINKTEPTKWLFHTSCFSVKLGEIFPWSQARVDCIEKEIAGEKLEATKVKVYLNKTLKTYGFNKTGYL